MKDALVIHSGTAGKPQRIGDQCVGAWWHLPCGRDLKLSGDPEHLQMATTSSIFEGKQHRHDIGHASGATTYA
ncbi:MAG: hypothetical protein IPK99_17895 [Flavobacteriales bacterium]|nr:hypothetical protein [Flavobacteriales bacterium]